MKRKNYADAWLLALRRSFRNSEFIHHVVALRPERVVLYLRVSNRNYADHLKDQKARLRREMKRLRIEVVAIYDEVAPGYRFDLRVQFSLAVLKAKATSAVIVAETVDRLIRGCPYSKEEKYSIPNYHEMQRMIIEANGVKLATFKHPDSSPSKIRSYQTKRGQREKGRLGGRPPEKCPTKARKRRLLPRALEFFRAGYGYREIGRTLEVPHNTVRSWILSEKKTARPQTSAETTDHH